MEANNMAKEEMRSCPFCGGKVAPIYPWLQYFDENKMWSFNHFCNTNEKETHFCINLTAKSKEEIINRWNGKFD